MPMEMFWIPLLAVLLQTSTSSDPTVFNVAVGGSVTFRVNSKDKTAALWKFGEETIVGMDFMDNSNPLFFKPKFKTRFTVSERGRALSISQLSMEDSGTYSVTINDEKTTFILHVFRELAEPTVTCERQNCSGGSCSFSLRCSAPGAGVGNVSYSWRVGDETRSEDSELLVVEEEFPLEGPEPLTCTVWNAVSNRNVTVPVPGELCRDTRSGNSVVIGVLAGFGVVVLLLVLLVLLCKSKGWRKFHISKSKPTNTAHTGEYTTMYAEVGSSQQRVLNGIKAKAAAAESPKTVYSLVKRPERVGDGMEANDTQTVLELD